MYGTLLGYSDDTTIGHARKLAAMIGAEWRTHNKAVINGSNDAHNLSHFLTHVEPLPYNQAGDGLRSMHGEASGMMIAVHHVKGRLLVAAMIPLEEQESPPADNIEERMESLQIFEADDAAPADVNEEAANDDGYVFSAQTNAYLSAELLITHIVVP